MLDLVIVETPDEPNLDMCGANNDTEDLLRTIEIFKLLMLWILRFSHSIQQRSLGMQSITGKTLES